MKKAGRLPAKRPGYQGAVLVALATSVLVIRPLAGTLWDGWDITKAVVGTIGGILAAPVGPWASGAGALAGAGAVDILERGVTQGTTFNGAETNWHSASG